MIERSPLRKVGLMVWMVAAIFETAAGWFVVLPTGRGRARPRWTAVAVVGILVAAGFAIAVSLTSTSGASGATIVTLGNQERQDITAANQWVEGNIDFWLEGQLYDAAVRWDSGTGDTTMPSTVDFSYSFFFSAQNAVVVDWVQDWRVTLDATKMFHAKSDMAVSGPFTCPTPPSIIAIPKGGTSILMPEFGSICASSPPLSPPTSSPANGWADLTTGLTASQFTAALPKRNEACVTIDSTTGLCSQPSGFVESPSSPTGEHFFRLSLSALFGSGGPYASAYATATGGTFPTLKANHHVQLYFRAHLALTAIWNTGSEGAQPEFCITKSPGSTLNTVNRCNWTAPHLGAGFSPGSKNHGTVNCAGCGSKTIPLPQVVAPTGFITVCKIVTPVQDDRFGTATGAALTNGWIVTVTSPLGFSLSKTTGSDGLGCSKFGPFFPSPDYRANETLKSGFTNIGTVVDPAADRDAALSGTNPSPSNPVFVNLTFNEASLGTGPTVTYVNFKPTPSCSQSCSLVITDIHGSPVARTYAIAGDTLTITYKVTNTGNDAITANQTHSNPKFGPSQIFLGTLVVGASNTATRTYTVVKADGGTTISDTVHTMATDAFGNTVPVTNQDQTCSVIVRAPLITFTKHPVAADNVFAVPGSKVTYTITVTNSGDAPALVNVTDALGPGQTLLDGGSNTASGDAPSPADTSPTFGADYPAPVTIAWNGLSVGPAAPGPTTITLTFRVLVTATTDGFQLTGTMTLTATNTNFVDYSPSPNTAQNLVTVTRPILKLSQFGYTNSPNGTPTQGVVNGTAVYTVVFRNFGTSAALLSGSLVVSDQNAGGGTLSCWAFSGPATLSGCTLSWTNVNLDAAVGSVTFTLTISYHNMPTGALIDADLHASYTTPSDGLSFIPSGTPARIEFTIQAG